MDAASAAFTPAKLLGKNHRFIGHRSVLDAVADRSG
jgi:hypothetical protein